KVLVVDREFADVARAALELARVRPLLVSVDDPEFPDDAPYGKGAPVSDLDYEALVASGDAGYDWQPPADEWDAITLNYTSGTTGNPKGAVYHHRGAYLNAISNILEWDLPKHPVYLWTLPLFHCNGGCFPWTLAARAAVNVCPRKF